MLLHFFPSFFLVVVPSLISFIHFFFHLLFSLHHFTVTVQCQDSGNPPYSIKRNFSVQVSDVNEAPFDIRLNSSAVIEENVQMGYIIGLLTCKDPDIGQIHVFTVIGNYSSVFQVSMYCTLLHAGYTHGYTLLTQRCFFFKVV